MSIRPFGREEIDYCYDVLIGPYEARFKAENAWVGVNNLFADLTANAHVPSVVTTLLPRRDKQEETKVLRDILAQVSIPDHSCRVAHKLLKIMEREHGDFFKIQASKAVVAGLCHDVGKIPRYRLDISDHSLGSARMLDQYFIGYDVNWLGDVRTAITNHHRKSADPFTLSLKEADWSSREEELSGFAGAAAWEKWFSPEELLAMIESHINILVEGRECPAFSHKGIIYVSPDLLYHLAQKLMSDHNALDLVFLKPTEKSPAKMRIVSSLRGIGVIHQELPENWFGALYLIGTSRFKFTRFLTPLCPEFLAADPAQIEKRKAGWLNIIRFVTRVVKQEGVPVQPSPWE